MVKDDLRPTIEELLTFAHNRVAELKSREIEQVRIKIEEALFWLSYHHQIQLQKKIEEFGKEQLKKIKHLKLAKKQ